MKIRLKPVREQVVVLLGASSGIGRTTALEFARRGARVVVAARDEAGLNSLVNEIESDGGKALAVKADIFEFEQVRRVAEAAVSTFGHLDTGVQLAAVSLYSRFRDTKPEEFKRVIDVTLTGRRTALWLRFRTSLRSGRAR